MMQPDFHKRLKNFMGVFAMLFWPWVVGAAQLTSADCRPLQTSTGAALQSLVHSDAVLWKVSKAGSGDSYIFGTIHVSDQRVTSLPQPVSDALNNAGIYVMEALPDPEELVRFSQMMFFDDGTTLKNYLDDTLFNRVAGILQNYQYPAETVAYLKPWAAFLIMNYPAEEGMPLDLHLLDIAMQNGTEIHGLESLTEQGELFSDMALDTQMQFLLDTACNFNVIEEDFEKMKSLYLERDLQGLFAYSQKYSFYDEDIYQELIKRLLTDRNYRMVERAQPHLAKGGAFIAIGAMHLPGKEGVLSLLARQGYTITSVY